MSFTFLHTNDMHGTLQGDKVDWLRNFRSQTDLYFDTGDAIKTGNLGIPIKPEPVWPQLASLECTASVTGNRESHVLESALRAKMAGATHPILCGNLHRKNGSEVFPASVTLSVNGIKLGIIAVMVPMVTDRMKTKALSEFLWEPPIPTALHLAEELRPNVDCLIALTHIGFKQDQELAKAAPMLDIILGGHSHTVLEEPEKVGTVFICQGGSHNRFAGLYKWDGQLSGKLIAAGSV